MQDDAMVLNNAGWYYISVYEYMTTTLFKDWIKITVLFQGRR